MQDAELENNFKLLLGGVAQNDVQRVKNGYHALIVHGFSAVATIENKLNGGDWGHYKNDVQGRYLAVLLSLAQVIDPNAAHRMIVKLSSSKLHPFHQKTIKLISSRFEAAPIEAYIRGIPVVVSDELPNATMIKTYLARWLKSRTEQDISKLLRVDVIPYESQFGYLGNYNIFFSGIVLTWPSPQSNFLKRWGFTISTEFTFYHEVGHHALGHLEGGQVPEQEKEANEYAGRALRRAHPILFTFLFPLWGPYKLWRILRSKWDYAEDQ